MIVITTKEFENPWNKKKMISKGTELNVDDAIGNQWIEEKKAKKSSKIRLTDRVYKFNEVDKR